MTTKILFLDVDGVLNTDSMFKTPEMGTYVLCDKRIEMLNAMLEAVGAKVVLSSSWRNSSSHVAFLEERGALKHKHEDWRTGVEPVDLEARVYLANERGREVREWLSRHPEVTQYAIIDDLEFFLPEQHRFFVRTSPYFGLGKKHVRVLTRLLGSGLKQDLE